MTRGILAAGFVVAFLGIGTALYGFSDASVALNTLFRGGTVVIIGATLLGLSRPLNQWQRYGMAAMGSGVFLTSTTFLDPNSPFQSWAFLVAGGGLLLYLIATYLPSMIEKVER